ncbi:MAG TPA: hypothetical protein EYP35_00610 [Desulfobacterales bacterium]|nr:hypothetical protein [Desulfobacterales bacterium]
MNKQIFVFSLFVLMLGFLGSGSDTVDAKEGTEQVEVAPIEAAANALINEGMPTGWIDVISAEQVIINDTLYLLTDETAFLSGRDSLEKGGFVEFVLGHDNYVAQISVAIPSRSDIEMRRGEQFSRSVEEPEVELIEAGSQPRLENGVWVN